MVGVTGIEPVTPSMSTKCSPAELHAHCHAEAGKTSRPEEDRITGLCLKDKKKKAGSTRVFSHSGRRASGGHEPIDFGHQIAQMEGL